MGDLNARIHPRQIGEEDYFGDFCSGRPLFDDDPLSNRQLLLELCATNNLQVANAFSRNQKIN